METPKEGEYIRIAELFAENTGTDIEDAVLQLKGMITSVIRGYQSDGPGWCGDLFIFIGGEPNLMFYVGRSSYPPARRNEEEWQIFFAGDIY